MYKSRPTDEFSSYGILNSFELKTLFVIDAEENSGKGYGRRMMEHVIFQAQKNNLSSIHGTISGKLPEVLKFFRKYNFGLVTEFPDKYRVSFSSIRSLFWLVPEPMVEFFDMD